MLLLLPFSSTPPLINFLFLLSLLVSQRPCIYCSVLLIAIGASSCAFLPGRCWFTFGNGNLFAPLPLASFTSNVTANISTAVAEAVEVKSTILATILDALPKLSTTPPAMVETFVAPVVESAKVGWKGEWSRVGGGVYELVFPFGASRVKFNFGLGS